MKTLPFRIAAFLLILFATLCSLFWPGAEANTQSPVPKPPKRQMENLGRGVVALNQGNGKIFVSWRMLGTDPDDIAFNLYRVTGDGAPVKLNAKPITESTNYVDTGVDTTRANAYFVRPNHQAPHLHPHARPAVSPGHRLAERRLQSAAAPELLPG